jgi:uncharacterized SAM-binding protein YcdF (DUF218 family)
LILLILVCLIVLLLVAGNRIFADWFVRTLEGRYLQLDPLAGKPIGQAVLLGGATGETEAGGLQVNENGDRVVMAARLYHCGVVRKLFCSGARSNSRNRFATDEAEQSRRLLEELGVPASAIELIGGCNTSEEMSAIAKVVAGQQVGLISSAWHLPRVMRLANAANIEAIPIPCGFLSNLSRPRSWRSILLDFVPNHRALMMNTYAAKEHLAMLLRR